MRFEKNIMKDSNAIFYATLAALCNAFVGIFSVLLFQENFTSFEVAFLKCLIAGLILLSYLYFFKKFQDLLVLIKKHFKALLLCAFFGFFMLYHFESSAYVGMCVASVVFTLFASSLWCAFLCQCVYQKRFFTPKEIISLILAFIGLTLIFISEGGSLEDFSNIKALIQAILAGFGYGLFLFFTKYFNLKTGFLGLCALLLIGSFYLAFPMILNTHLNFNLNFQNLSLLLALALLPTIGGFYCTIKALSLTSSNSVALIELSEPIFAMILAFALLAQSPNLSQILGGLCILAAIIFYEFKTPRVTKD